MVERVSGGLLLEEIHGKLAFPLLKLCLAQYYGIVLLIALFSYILNCKLVELLLSLHGLVHN